MKSFNMTSPFAAVVMAVVLSACGGGGGGETSAISAHSEQQAHVENVNTAVTIEINGDSICGAVGIKTTCAEMMPSEWKVDDRAIGGLTLHALMNGYSSVWANGPLGKNGVQQAFHRVEHPSNYVVIELGGNDAYNAYSNEEFAFNMRNAIRDIIMLGKTPIVTGIVPFKASGPDYFPGGPFDAGVVSRALELNAIVHKVAAEMGVMDVHWDEVAFDPATETVDGIHRTEPAVRRLVKKLVDDLTTELARGNAAPTTPTESEMVASLIRNGQLVR